MIQGVHLLVAKGARMGKMVELGGGDVSVGAIDLELCITLQHTATHCNTLGDVSIGAIDLHLQLFLRKGSVSLKVSE